MSPKRRKSLEQKKAAKNNRYLRDGKTSRYARKVAWCLKNGVDAREVPMPKPWN